MTYYIAIMDILPAAGCHSNNFRLCENSDSTFLFFRKHCYSRKNIAYHIFTIVSTDNFLHFFATNSRNCFFLYLHPKWTIAFYETLLLTHFEHFATNNPIWVVEQESQKVKRKVKIERRMTTSPLVLLNVQKTNLEKNSKFRQCVINRLFLNLLQSVEGFPRCEKQNMVFSIHLLIRPYSRLALPCCADWPPNATLQRTVKRPAQLQ